LVRRCHRLNKNVRRSKERHLRPSPRLRPSNIAFALLVYFIIVGPTLLQLNSFTQETGAYLANIIPQSFNMAAFEPQESTWLAD
jgi:hypothetical protein